MTTLRVDGSRFLKDLDALAAMGRTSGRGVSRVAFSRVDVEARRWLTNRCVRLGWTLSWTRVTEGSVNPRRVMEHLAVLDTEVARHAGWQNQKTAAARQATESLIHCARTLANK